MARPPAPLFMVSSRPAERSLQLPQEINIPDIISSQPGSQESSWEPSKQGVESGLVCWSSVENLFSRRPQETVPNKQKGCWGNWWLGTRGSHCSPREKDGVSEFQCRWYWASAPTTELLKAPGCASMTTTRVGQDGPIVQAREAEAPRGRGQHHSQNTA